MDIGLLSVLLFFSFMATEGTVEYVLGTAFDKVVTLQPYRWLLMYVSLGLGIFLAFHYDIDIPFMLLGLPTSPVGTIGTGVILGRGANFVNDVWAKFLQK